MAFFSKILEKLGFGSSANPAPQTSTAAPASPAAAPTQTAPKSVAVVDVVAQLEQRAAANPQKLNWRTSIVDLMKLVGLDSSLQHRKELAKELGYTGNTDDSATMNIWLHKEVMKKLAANGGKVPASLQ